ncbi:zinc finger domain-containing protein [Streptomyces sp. NPDC055817]
MTFEWSPTQDDVAATRQLRQSGGLKSHLRQQIADGRTKIQPATQWAESRQRRDLYGTPCPHCGAGVDQKCHLRTRSQQLPKPHPQRAAAWAQTVAPCPECQVGAGTPCHATGIPLPHGTVHNRRYQEAEATAA